MALLRRIADYLVIRGRRVQAVIAPGDDVVRGGAWGLLVGTVIVLLLKFTERYRNLGSAILFLNAPFAVAISLLVGAVLLVVVHLVSALPRLARLVLVASLVVLMTRTFSGALPERLVPTLYVAAVSIVLGAAIMVLRKRRFALLSRIERVVVVAALLSGLGAARRRRALALRRRRRQQAGDRRGEGHREHRPGDQRARSLRRPALTRCSSSSTAAARIADDRSTARARS